MDKIVYIIYQYFSLCSYDVNMDARGKEETLDM